MKFESVALSAPPVPPARRQRDRHDRRGQRRGQPDATGQRSKMGQILWRSPELLDSTTRMYIPLPGPRARMCAQLYHSRRCAAISLPGDYPRLDSSIAAAAPPPMLSMPLNVILLFRILLETGCAKLPEHCDNTEHAPADLLVFGTTQLVAEQAAVSPKYMNDIF
eukprot:6213233-Pleurochrysis_carterae.AAC.1